MIVLCSSQTHVFITIFKIFFLTVIFGLFHGVVLLPVILCYLGPNHADQNKVGPQEQVESYGTIKKENNVVTKYNHTIHL